MLSFLYRVFLFISCLIITSCSTQTNYAPVSDITTTLPIAKPVKTPQIKQFSQLSTKKINKTIVLDTTNSDLPVPSWAWPAKGKIIHPFSSENKGINIAGYQGEPVYASANGKVVYCGDGLRGYGNLIILKHNKLYLSAYAHNERVMVKEGEFVKKGQKIAEMGSDGKNKTMLHFEIRRAGQPIDPISLLNPS